MATPPVGPSSPLLPPHEPPPRGTLRDLVQRINSCVDRFFSGIALCCASIGYVILDYPMRAYEWLRGGDGPCGLRSLFVLYFTFIARADHAPIIIIDRTTIRSDPSGVLQTLLVYDQVRIRFSDSPVAVGDGVFRECIGELSKSLGDHETFREGDSAAHETLGRYFSFLHRQASKGATTGPLKPIEFYTLLKGISEGKSISELAFLIGIPEQKIIARYADDPARANALLELLGYSPTAEGATEYLEEIFGKRVKDAQATYRSASLELQAYIATHTAEDLSVHLQGSSLDAEAIIQAISLPEIASETLKTRHEWIQNFLRDHADNPDILRQFLMYVTGAPALTPTTRIRLLENGDGYFQASTCFQRMSVPNAEMTKEEFLQHLFDAINESSLNQE